MGRRYRFWVYIMTNQHNTVLYTGMTNNIMRRVHEHREGKGGYFTSQHNISKLVYAEEYQYVDQAIARKKQIKKISRQAKLDLINTTNPNWSDLTTSFMTEAN